MKKLLILVFLNIGLYAGVINVALAANVSYAIDALKAAFEKQHPQITIHTTLGGSGKLTAQIFRGAPYDILMSADMKYPQALYEKGLSFTKPRVYAQGSLALFSSRARDFSQGLHILTQSRIKRIAIANPKTAPYGKASVEALKNAGLYKALKHKFVYAESISQTVAYAVTAADIGLIAKSSLYCKKMKVYTQNKHWIEIDSQLYTPIQQGIIILKQGQNNPEVQAFYEFILGPEAKKIFKEYGYQVL